MGTCADLERISEGAAELQKNLQVIAAADASAGDAVAMESSDAASAEPPSEPCGPETPEGQGAFVSRVGAFQRAMESEAARLKEGKGRLAAGMKGLAEAFGEEADNAPWVFRTLNTFARQYAKIQEDNREIQEAL